MTSARGSVYREQPAIEINAGHPYFIRPRTVRIHVATIHVLNVLGGLRGSTIESSVADGAACDFGA